MPFPSGIPSEAVPNGLDWADGLDNRPGTPTPDNAILVAGSVSLEEFRDSPEVELGQQGTVQHRFRMPYELGKIYLAALNRGTYLEDSFGNITRVLTARLVRQVASFCQLIVTAESISFDNPPDEFNADTIELNPALEKHPRYAFIPSDIRNQINNAISGATVDAQQEQVNLINQISARPGSPPSYTTNSGATYSPTWTQVAAAAGELLLKRRIGEDTFYLPGFRVVWARYFWRPPPMNPGGYIEDPILQGGFPDYFWSTDGTRNIDTSIFAGMEDLNPQFYKDPTLGTLQISWLRQADHCDYQRTWFRLTHTWLGAPYGHWDDQVYSDNPSPYPPPPKFPLS